MSGSETQRRVLGTTLLSWLVRKRMHQLEACATCTMPDVKHIDVSEEGGNWRIGPISGADAEGCRQSLLAFLVEAKNRFNLPDHALLERT